MNAIQLWLITMLAAGSLVACGEDGTAAANCGLGTIEQDGACVPDPGEPDIISDGDVQTDTTPPDGGPQPDTTNPPDTGPAAPTLPMAVDDFFYPSGFMGDGETPGNLDADGTCPQRAGDEMGDCHAYSYTASDAGWAGVLWQHPDGNWGDDAGLQLPAGATQVSFWAWGASGGETVAFNVGIEEADGFTATSGDIALTNAPMQYTISLTNKSYDVVVSAFGWAAPAGATNPMVIYIDDIQWQAVADPNQGLCDALCADVTALSGCGTAPTTEACISDCLSQASGLCATEYKAVATCVGTNGLECNGAGDAWAPVAACLSENDDWVACTAAGPELPLTVDEWFFPTGYMGDGETPGAIVDEIEAGACPQRAGEEKGDCHKFTYTPGGTGWAGVYWQHPDGNWGEATGLPLPQGAVEVSFWAWTDNDGHGVKFASGMTDPDGFQIEIGDIPLTTAPVKYTIDLTGVTYTNVVGGFAWFTAAPTAGSLVFYVDDIQYLAAP